MFLPKRITIALAALVLSAPVANAQYRDGARPQPTPPAAAVTPQRQIPNPYVPPAAARDRAADAYATGFAIGLGTALINKQREDEAKRQGAPGKGQ